MITNDEMTLDKLAELVLTIKDALDEHREDSNKRFDRLEALTETLVEGNSLIRDEMRDIKRTTGEFRQSEVKQDQQIEDLDNRVTLLELV